MMYEIFMRYVLFKPTLWANELCLWLAGVCYLVGGIYATRLRSHIRIVLLYDWVSRPTQRIFDLISTLIIVLFAAAVKALNEMGVTLHDWSREDRLKFRQAALAAWEEWKTKSPEAAALIEIHKAYMKANGIM